MVCSCQRVQAVDGKLLWRFRLSFKGVRESRSDFLCPNVLQASWLGICRDRWKGAWVQPIVSGVGCEHLRAIIACGTMSQWVTLTADDVSSLSSLLRWLRRNSLQGMMRLDCAADCNVLQVRCLVGSPSVLWRQFHGMHTTLVVLLCLKRQPSPFYCTSDFGAWKAPRVENGSGKTLVHSDWCMLRQYGGWNHGGDWLVQSFSTLQVNQPSFSHIGWRYQLWRAWIRHPKRRPFMTVNFSPSLLHSFCGVTLWPMLLRFTQTTMVCVILWLHVQHAILWRSRFFWPQWPWKLWSRSRRGALVCRQTPTCLTDLPGCLARKWLPRELKDVMCVAMTSGWDSLPLLKRGEMTGQRSHPVVQKQSDSSFSWILPLCLQFAMQSRCYNVQMLHRSQRFQGW